MAIIDEVRRASLLSIAIMTLPSRLIRPSFSKVAVRSQCSAAANVATLTVSVVSKALLDAGPDYTIQKT